MKTVMIIGASSGIGKACALKFAELGFRCILTARRIELLEEIRSKYLPDALIRKMDLCRQEEAISIFKELCKDAGSIDIVLISSGTGHVNKDLDWQLEKDTIDLNVSGFTAIADAAANYFIERQAGHLAAISSVAALKGHGDSPAYGASKSYQSIYLQSLRHKFLMLKLPVCVTEIQPGFVDTAMAKGPGLFWVASPEKAAAQIVHAIVKKKKHIYVSRRWKLVAWILKILPESIYFKISS